LSKNYYAELVFCYFNWPWRTLRYWPLGNQKTQIFCWGSSVVISCDTLIRQACSRSSTSV